MLLSSNILLRLNIIRFLINTDSLQSLKITSINNAESYSKGHDALAWYVNVNLFSKLQIKNVRIIMLAYEVCMLNMNTNIVVQNVSGFIFNFSSVQFFVFLSPFGSPPQN